MRSSVPGLVLSALVALAACSGGDHTPTTPPPEGQGELKFTIQRLANSNVPSIADSAVIRVWNTGLGINQVQAVKIPAPGATTQAVFVVPGGTGYQVAVLPFKRQFVRYAVAGGRTDNITVITGQDNPVSVNVQPIAVALLGPDSITSGASTEFLLRVRGGGPIGGVYSAPFLCLSKVRNTFDVCNPATVLDDSTFQIVYPPISVPFDSSLYAQVRFRSSDEWPTEMNANPAWVYYPNTTLGVGDALRYPIRRTAGSTVLTVSVPTAGLPAGANRVVVRVWKAGGTDQVQYVYIPSSSVVEARFSMPGGGTGYEAAASVVDEPPCDLCGAYGMAGGHVTNLTLVAGANNRTTVSVQPYQVAVLGPDTLISGQTDTFTLRFRGIGAVTGLYSNTNLCMSLTRWTATGGPAPACVAATAVDDTTFQAVLTAPTVTADSAAFMQTQFRTSAAWHFDEFIGAPDILHGGTLLRRPVKVASGTTITVSFDKSKQH